MVVVAMVFGFFLAVLVGEILRKEEYTFLALLCYMGGIFYALYMTQFL